MQQALPRKMGASSSTPTLTQRKSPGCMGSSVIVRASVNIEQLKGARADVEKLIRDVDAGPIIIRLGWHDSGTYNKSISTWPERGGAIGSIRFDPESGHAANKGLKCAVDLLKPVKEKFPDVSYADIFQMASATAIEVAGGPKVPMRYGRKDARDHKDCAVEGNLPDAGAPFKDGSKTPSDHLRKVFYRMGLNDQEIVALSGAHTLGRSHKDRSGWAKEATPYTTKGSDKWTGNNSASGGQSWTENWLHFDNSYFTNLKEKRDADLLILPTDAALFEDDSFRPFAEKYAADEEAFFADYAQAHAKLSELGVEWVEDAPVTI